MLLGFANKKKLLILYEFQNLGQKIQILQDGSHFGEIALFIKGQKRTATIKSLETCEVYKLSQRDFRNVIEPHHDIVRKIEEIAKERLRKINQQDQGSFFNRRITNIFKC